MSSTEYIHNLSCDNIRVAGVGLEDTCVPNVKWIEESYVAQNSFGTSVSSQFANKILLDGINQALSTTSHPNFQSVTVDALPASSNSLTARAYVDSAIAAVSAGPGIGLSKIAGLFNIDPSLPHITSMGGCFAKGVNDVYLSSGSNKNLHLGNGVHGVGFVQTGDTFVNYNNSGLIKLCNSTSVKFEVGSYGVSCFGDLLVNNLRKGDNLGMVSVFSGVNSTGGASLELYGISHGGNGNMVLNSMKELYVKSYISGAFVSNLVVSSTGAYAFQNVTDSTNSSLGAATFLGGVGIGKHLFVGSNAYVAGSAYHFNHSLVPLGIDSEVPGGSTPFLNLGVNSRSSSQKTINTSFPGSFLRVSPSNTAQTFSFYSRPAGSATDTLVHTIGQNGETVIGGTGALTFSNTNTGIPLLNARSPGTKLVLYSSLSATSTDYALGVNGGEFWQSTSDTGSNFKWYHGNFNSMTLTSTTLTTNANITALNLSTGGASSTWGSGLSMQNATAYVNDNSKTSFHKVGKICTIQGVVILTSQTGGSGTLQINLPIAAAFNFTYKDVVLIKNGVSYTNPELNVQTTNVIATLTYNGGQPTLMVPGDSMYVKMSYVSI